MTTEGQRRAEPAGIPEAAAPAADPRAPYARVAAVGLVRREDARQSRQGAATARWLLLRRTGIGEIWDPPGGRMEWAEDLTATVLREVAEECGLQVEVRGPCYALLTMYKGERLLAVSMACRAVGDPDAVPLQASEAAQWRWVSAEEWEVLAAQGKSSWTVGDVRKATRTATALWRMEEQ